MGSGFRVKDLGLRVWSLELRVYGLGFRVEVFGWSMPDPKGGARARLLSGVRCKV